MASVGAGKSPKILLSSGHRKIINNELGDNDAGVMALRTPDDLINVIQIVMNFNRQISYDALHTSGTIALQHAQQRRFGSPTISTGDGKAKATGGMVVSGIRLEAADAKQPNIREQTNNKNHKIAAQETTSNSQAIQDGSDSFASDEEDHQDGFIAF